MTDLLYEQSPIVNLYRKLLDDACYHMCARCESSKSSEVLFIPRKKEEIIYGPI